MEVNNQHNLIAEPIGVTASGVVVYGLTLSEWVAILTMVYLMIHIMLLIPRFFQAYRSVSRIHRRAKSRRRNSAK